ncbi:MAG: hypothetical protein MUO31_14640, partial [Thermodesulfovibrionales bacterium]|nr:hypothetical protein [Thermodesulfovibrionales bacterium]
MTQDVVAEFLNHKKPGSQGIYARGLQLFQKFYEPKGTIADFLDLVEKGLKQTSWREREPGFVTDILIEFVDYLKAQGLSPNSVRSYVSSVQRLCKFHHLPVSLLDVNLPPPDVQNEKYSWNLQKVGQFVEGMNDPMYRSLSSLFFQSGVGIFEATHLTYQSIKEEYEKGISPICLSLRRKKTGVKFMTFIGSWSVGLLRNYLEGKNLKPDDPLFDVTKEAIDSYFRTQGRAFLGSYNTARNPCRPYSLRAAFKTLANKANVIDNFKVEYFMGHETGHSMDQAYTSLDLEGWRETYRQI